MCDLTFNDFNSWYYSNDYSYTFPFVAYSGCYTSVLKIYMKDKPVIEKLIEISTIGAYQDYRIHLAYMSNLESNLLLIGSDNIFIVDFKTKNVL